MITETNLKNIISPVINKVKQECDTIKTELNKGWIDEDSFNLIKNGGSNAVPVGTIKTFNTGETIDNTWLPCIGSTLQIDDYPELANFYEVALGSKNYYGGDGETTFQTISPQSYSVVGTDITKNTVTLYEDENIVFSTSPLEISSSTYPNLGDLFNNDDTSTKCIYSAASKSTGVSESNPFTILIKLKNGYRLTNIQLYAWTTTYCRCKDFIVSGSTDNLEYVELGRYTYTNNTNMGDFTINNSLQYNYIKLDFISTYVTSTTGYSCIAFKGIRLNGININTLPYIKSKPTSCIQVNLHNNYGSFDINYKDSEASEDDVDDVVNAILGGD